MEKYCIESRGPQLNVVLQNKEEEEKEKEKEEGKEGDKEKGRSRDY
jgi:hypothetical protein